jgi:hypothetical protein
LGVGRARRVGRIAVQALLKFAYLGGEQFDLLTQVDTIRTRLRRLRGSWIFHEIIEAHCEPPAAPP